jgi:RNA polymerase sigma factor (sigma-70 family)
LGHILCDSRLCKKAKIMNALILKPINLLYKIFKVYLTIGILGALAVIVVEFVIEKPFAFLIFVIAVSFLLIGIMLWAQARKLEQTDRSANELANPEAWVTGKEERSANEPATPAAWLDQHGAYLFNYALFRLRDYGAAKDVLQETFLTAFESYEKFDVRGSERTWLIGILRNKITDHFRRANREIAVGENLEESSEHRRFLEGAVQRNGVISFLRSLISSLRSLSFGGLLGCGVAYLIFLSYPHLFVGRVSLEVVVVFGGLLGAWLYRVIEWCLVKPFLLPFGRLFEYYAKLVQLTLQNRAELIDDDSYKKIKYQLDLAYFLGPTDKVRVRKGALPPGKT